LRKLKRKVLAITGIRSDYDIIYPVLRAINDDNRFQLKLIVCGAHLSDWHGNTLKNIINDNFTIADKIDNLFMTNRKTQRVKGIGTLISAMSQTVEREAPDFLFVPGDREESIATAIIGNYMDILVAHLGGGDPVWGNADDPIRFAVSKLAHIHFTQAKEYADNLLKTGEDKFRVFSVGNPSLDNIRNTKKIKIAELAKFLNFDISRGNYLILVKHPLSSEKEQSELHMKLTLQALDNFCNKYNFKIVASYPNTDPGSYDIINVLNKYERLPHFKFFKNIPHDIFVNLLRNARAVVGNSSLGILESPYYKLPVVNIGNRQQGRLNAGNIKFVDHDINKIIKSLKEACFDKKYRDYVSKVKNPFGNGKTSQKIVKILSSINNDDKKWYIKNKLC
tara:strand:- start:2415 stop:3593 length:1179 start_codon:yes stop_codon:yes gene_type:complete